MQYADTDPVQGAVAKKCRVVRCFPHRLGRFYL